MSAPVMQDVQFDWEAFKAEKGRIAFFLCDVQDRFREVITEAEKGILVGKMMASAAQILGVPLVVTEQYPKALGHTVSDIDVSKAVKVVEKTKFSMIVDESVGEFLATNSISRVAIFGWEAHVCVQQTVEDLASLEHVSEIILVADGISSQRALDREVALRALDKMPKVRITTAESLLFGLIRSKDHPCFKQISALAKEYAAGLKPPSS